MSASVDFTRLALVYVHLLACCVALGSILIADVRMLVRLVKGIDEVYGEHMITLQRTVCISLLILCFTGLYLVVNDSLKESALRTLSNPKLQAKLIVVTLLSLNGVLLHYVIMPMIAKAGSLLTLNPQQRMLAIGAGAISGVSWMYASFLGLARPLSWKFTLLELMAAYPILIVGSVVLIWSIANRAIQLHGNAPGKHKFQANPPNNHAVWYAASRKMRQTQAGSVRRRTS